MKSNISKSLSLINLLYAVSPNHQVLDTRPAPKLHESRALSSSKILAWLGDKDITAPVNLRDLSQRTEAWLH
jgi:hypothetical protein